jgi:ribosomal protein L37AE/L43A
MKVKAPTLASRFDYLLCPVCQVGELHSLGGESARCSSCGYILGVSLLLTLEQIIALPDALGKHACECGHPEMRRLPDGAFHCPSCGSEVLPIEAVSGPS